MEKRRRARINQCLNEIKTLILEAMKKDVRLFNISTYIHTYIYACSKYDCSYTLQPARHSKLEKADILEMAVKHLQNVQRQQLAMAIAGDPTVLRRFKTGFEECARQVSTYIDQIDRDEEATTTTTTRIHNKKGLKGRIAEHLTKCMGGIEHVARFNLVACGGNFPFFQAVAPRPINANDVTNTMNSVIMSARSGTNYKTNENNNNNDKNDDNDADDDDDIGGDDGEKLVVRTDDDLNNNPAYIQQRRSQNILHLIPSRLPTGELAFLVPNSNHLLSSKLSRLLNANDNIDRQCIISNDVNYSDKIDRRQHHNSAFVAVTPSSSRCDDQTLRKLPLLKLTTTTTTTISPPPSPADDEDVVLLTSPRRGFRPINNSALQNSYRSAFLSTAKPSAVNLKIDHQSDDRKSTPKSSSQHPLCIITNQSERFKQAQIPTNSINCEENRCGLKKRQQIADQDYFPSDIDELSPSYSTGGGLLTVSTTTVNDQHYHRSKVIKATSTACYPSQFRHRVNYNVYDNATTNIESLSPLPPQPQPQDNISKESCGDNGGVDNSDMWRPW